MLIKDRPIFMQNINGIERQLFLLSKKSTTFWDNPRKSRNAATQIDFIRIRKRMHTLVPYVKVIPGEEVALQH